MVELRRPLLVEGGQALAGIGVPWKVFKEETLLLAERTLVGAVTGRRQHALGTRQRSRTAAGETVDHSGSKGIELLSGDGPAKEAPLGRLLPTDKAARQH